MSGWLSCHGRPYFDDGGVLTGEHGAGIGGLVLCCEWAGCGVIVMIKK